MTSRPRDAAVSDGDGDGSRTTSASRSADAVSVISVPPSDCSISEGIGALRGSPSGPGRAPATLGPSTALPMLNALPLPLPLGVRCGVTAVADVTCGSELRRARERGVPLIGVPAAPKRGLPLEELGEIERVPWTRPDCVGGP